LNIMLSLTPVRDLLARPSQGNVLLEFFWHAAHRTSPLDLRDMLMNLDENFPDIFPLQKVVQTRRNPVPGGFPAWIAAPLEDVIDGQRITVACRWFEAWRDVVEDVPMILATLNAAGGELGQAIAALFAFAGTRRVVSSAQTDTTWISGPTLRVQCSRVGAFPGGAPPDAAAWIAQAISEVRRVAPGSTETVDVQTHIDYTLHLVPRVLVVDCVGHQMGAQEHFPVTFDMPVHDGAMATFDLHSWVRSVGTNHYVARVMWGSETCREFNDHVVGDMRLNISIGFVCDSGRMLVYVLRQSSDLPDADQGGGAKLPAQGSFSRWQALVGTARYCLARADPELRR
jgi:hypothetical protein